MEPIPHRCGNCGADTQSDHAAGLTYCSACGGAPQVPVYHDGQKGSDTMTRTTFWLLFFAPQGVFLAGSILSRFGEMFFGLGGVLGFGTAFFTAILCGRELVSRLNPPGWRWQLYQFGISVLIFAFHFTALFAGCAIAS